MPMTSNIQKSIDNWIATLNNSAVTNPTTAPIIDLIVDSAGFMSAGLHKFKYTLVNAFGETLASAVLEQTFDENNTKFKITIPAITDTTVTTWKLYATKANSDDFYFIATYSKSDIVRNNLSFLDSSLTVPFAVTSNTTSIISAHTIYTGKGSLIQSYPFILVDDTELNEYTQLSSQSSTPLTYKILFAIGNKLSGFDDRTVKDGIQKTWEDLFENTTLSKRVKGQIELTDIIRTTNNNTSEQEIIKLGIIEIRKDI